MTGTHSEIEPLESTWHGMAHGQGKPCGALAGSHVKVSEVGFQGTGTMASPNKISGGFIGELPRWRLSRCPTSWVQRLLARAAVSTASTRHQGWQPFVK